jgi:hypothetical protein
MPGAGPEWVVAPTLPHDVATFYPIRAGVFRFRLAVKLSFALGAEPLDPVNVQGRIGAGLVEPALEFHNRRTGSPKANHWRGCRSEAHLALHE